MCWGFFQKLFERKEKVCKQEKQINHDDSRIEEIAIEKSFWDQNFQTEICGNEKFVPFKCIKVNTMEQLRFLFDQMLEKEKSGELFLYRGQSNSDWFIESTLEREIKKYNIHRCSRDIEKKVFFKFKENLRGKLIDQSLLKVMHIEDERELWAIGRHYDLKTPFIDWSSSIYVALFMACAEPKRESEMATYCALFIVDSFFFPECQGLVERYWFTPKTDYYGRITAQKGFLSHFYIRDEISIRLNKGEDCAFKIYINNSLRNEILAYLKHIRFEYTTMYPDLLGAVKFANNELTEWLIDDFEKNRKEQANQQSE